MIFPMKTLLYDLLLQDGAYCTLSEIFLNSICKLQTFQDTIFLSIENPKTIFDSARQFEKFC